MWFFWVFFGGGGGGCYYVLLTDISKTLDLWYLMLHDDVLDLLTNALRSLSIIFPQR